MKTIEGGVNLDGLYLEELPEFLNGVVITGYFDCSHNKLKSLKNAPSKVMGGFYCASNNLRTLEGLPELGGDLYCHKNQLRSLVGSPAIIKGSFSCSYNLLHTLEGAPSQVWNSFYCWGNPGGFTAESVGDVCLVRDKIFV